MKHYIKPNHKFIVVKKDSVRALYSAQHLGRVDGWIKRNSEFEESELEVLNKADFYARENEEVEISFINPITGKETTIMLDRRSVGTCCDPSTERYWTM